MTIAHVNTIDIWYETFGKKEDEAVLLIMGGCCQGILWPTEFCQQLAETGFFVIRYDHRDTGLSTYFDWEKDPYTLYDMMNDAIGLLNFLKVEQFYLMGLSLGVQVAELIAVHHPKRTKGIMLISSSCDFRPMNRGYAGLPTEEGGLSPVKEIYLEWIKQFINNPPKNQQEHIQFRVNGWRILSGDKVPFEEEDYYQLHKAFITRARHPESHLNHIHICSISEHIIKTIPLEIRVPTIVIQGSEDPIFPPDHGEALASAIKNSKYILADGMGHVPSCHFYELFIESIKSMRVED